MNLEFTLRTEIQKALKTLFNESAEQLQLQPTNAEFEGSHTLVCFPLTKVSKLKPEETAKVIGDYLVQHSGIVARYNVVKGFLNLVIADKTWAETFATVYGNKKYGQLPDNGKEIDRSVHSKHFLVHSRLYIFKCQRARNGRCSQSGLSENSMAAHELFRFKKNGRIDEPAYF